jgi:hypothetical protein
MKAPGFTLFLVLISLSTAAFAQSEAQSSFDKLKALAGAWEGIVTTIPPKPTMDGKPAQVWLRVTSMGNALMHELKITGRPDDPITMLYVDGDRLLLTHYCDVGNRPRMVGKMAPDARTVQFDFLDLTGSTKPGHMHNASFTTISPDHHVEEWIFMEGTAPLRLRFDLQRKKQPE